MSFSIISMHVKNKYNNKRWLKYIDKGIVEKWENISYQIIQFQQYI